MNLTLRAQFANIFNRTYLPDPVNSNALASQNKNAAGATTSGFGMINTGSPYFLGPRTGKLEARFTF